MWFLRAAMASCAALVIWGSVAGNAARLVTGVICLAVNAANAEFCRRQL
jgi:hypothetical protein